MGLKIYRYIDNKLLIAKAIDEIKNIILIFAVFRKIELWEY